jgi:hypothetical protein
MIKWSATPGAAACALGYQALINGSTPTGNRVALALGMSLLPAGTWPKGTRLSVALTNVCTGAPATAPFTITIQ